MSFGVSMCVDVDVCACIQVTAHKIHTTLDELSFPAIFLYLTIVTHVQFQYCTHENHVGEICTHSLHI